MNRLEQVCAVGSVARQLPAALLRRGCHARVETATENAHYPVVLAHGYVGSEAVWTPLRAALTSAGFGYHASLDYSCFDCGPDGVAAELVQQATLALERTGAPGVHLVGHSLGGLIVRHATTHPDLAARTAAVVTIATPHRGAPLGRFAPGRCARILHGSQDVSDIEAPAAQRWIAYYSDRDRLVPAGSARLSDARLHATNMLIPDCGHLTICRDDRLIRSLVAELIRTELGDRHDAADRVMAAA